ncbi:class I SAM-dependent methyltransferase [Brevibacillus laterosporus]|nr:SAM-dependent methyltransferase [Brevibacillus laterosporus]RAP30710.1 hypothetical protein C2W64_01906 [Brevibacillus laterosporus]TPG89586.1 class I SAM-dependent methyltransferase [Brevibacillus laterosporus]
MIDNQESHTAKFVTYLRAYYSQNIKEPIFNDHLAYEFLTPKEYEMFSHEAEKMNVDHDFNRLLNMTMTRYRYTEDELHKAIHQGLQQYVILGAGMDSFGFRNKEVLNELKVFEVDHPATQSFKLNRVKELKWHIPENLIHIPIDFMKTNVKDGMKQSFDSNAFSFFSWLGVTMYLTKEAVFETLESISNLAPSGSIVIFDYFDYNDEKYVSKHGPTENTKNMLEYLEKIGEPVKMGFNLSTITEDLANVGFILKENQNFYDLHVKYIKNELIDKQTLQNYYIALAVVK